MKKQFSLLKTLALLSATGFLGIASHSVFAGDAKSLPGTNCIDASDQSEVSYSINGYLRNDVNGINRVVCPIVRDVMSGKNDHFVRSVRVKLRKFLATSTSCDLDSRSENGNTGVFKTGAVSGIGYRTVHIAQPVKSFSWGAMNLTCRLKDDDQVHDYNYWER